MKKSQSYSLDLILGVGLFLLAAVLFLGLLSLGDGDGFSVRDEAERVYAALDSGTGITPTGLEQVPKIFRENRIIYEDIVNLYFNRSYEQVRSSLGITGDFCIILIDDQGGIVTIQGPGGANATSFGPGDTLEIAEGIRC